MTKFRSGRRNDAAFEVLRVFLSLGLTSFGGPVAHLGYFRRECVGRLGWVDEVAYADIVALCQFLPGPASSQVAITLGMSRAGLPGALAAWVGFTMPSALAMIAFGYAVGRLGDPGHIAWLHGLKIVAVAVVAHAVWAMARTLCPDRVRASFAVGAALVVLAFPSPAGQIGAILLGALLGWRILPRAARPIPAVLLPQRIGPALSIGALAVFVLLLAGSPIAVDIAPDHALALFDRFYRTGALVFGGGHVVLPLLQQATVPSGWLNDDTFLAGYGAAQAVPGPLFTFAAYLGTVMVPGPNGWTGGFLCLIAIYLPSFLLLIGVLPHWDKLRRREAVRAALDGVNAAVVGLLLAALYTPVWTGAIFSPGDFAVLLVALLLLALWRVPPWLVVLSGAAAAQGMALV